jgi:hypothetical protein
MRRLRNLTELLARQYDDPDYLIDELAPSGGKVLVAAQGKAGKTTLLINLIRCLADGDVFLGRFGIRAGSQRIVVVDDELSDRQLQKWFREHNIRNTDAVADVAGLRGQAGLFNIMDERVRAQWAKRLRDLGCTTLVFDCLRPVFDALGLDENRDAGRFLVAFDALVYEAGISESFVVHHMGHSGERSRGDSRLVDWPDATWKLVLEEPDDRESPRYFSAYGRDVELHPSSLPPKFSAQELQLVRPIGARAGQHPKLHLNLAVVQDSCHRADIQVVVARRHDLHTVVHPQSIRPRRRVSRFRDGCLTRGRWRGRTLMRF